MSDQPQQKQKEEEEKPAGWFLRNWRKIRDAFSSTVMKYVLTAVVAGAASFLTRELYYNPMVRFELRGRVVLHDYPERGVENAAIYVEGKNFEAKTNEDGVFIGTMRVRKRSGAITVHCEKYGFQSEHKTVYIPLEKNPRQRTNFLLKPL
jgi:hypothetical protein